jgi:hypothetical protein
MTLNGGKKMIARQDVTMYSETGGNGLPMGLSFLAAVGSVSFIGVLSSVVVALLVGLLGKGIDILTRQFFQYRQNSVRKELVKLRAEVKRLRQQQ